MANVDYLLATNHSRYVENSNKIPSKARSVCVSFPGTQQLFWHLRLIFFNINESISNVS